MVDGWVSRLKVLNIVNGSRQYWNLISVLVSQGRAAMRTLCHDQQFHFSIVGWTLREECSRNQCPFAVRDQVHALGIGFREHAIYLALQQCCRSRE